MYDLLSFKFFLRTLAFPHVKGKCSYTEEFSLKLLEEAMAVLHTDHKPQLEEPAKT